MSGYGGRQPQGMLTPGSFCVVVGNYEKNKDGLHCDVNFNGQVIRIIYDRKLEEFMLQMLGKQILIRSSYVLPNEQRTPFVSDAEAVGQGNIGYQKQQGITTPNSAVSSYGKQYGQSTGQVQNNNSNNANKSRSLTNPLVPANFPPFRPIADLTYYCNTTGWTILGRVSKKSPLRTFRTQKDVEGSMFSFILTDAGGGEIQCKGFTDFCVNYSKILEGHTYFFTGGKIEAAKKKFNQTSHECEITFDRNTRIAQSSIEIPHIVSLLPIRSIDSIQTMMPGSLVDIICVVKSVGAKSEIMTKTNKTLQKTEVRVVDNSGSEIAMTFWNDDAVTAENQLSEGVVIAVSKCKISEFRNSKQLSVSGDLIISPQNQPAGSLNDDIIKKSLSLANWYQANKGISFQSMSSFENNTNETTSKCLPIKSVIDERLGLNDREFFTIRAYIIRISQKSLFYLACPNPKCNAKIIEGVNHCEKCNSDVVPTRRYTARFLVADDTGEMYLTAFDQQARTIFQKSADEVAKMTSSSDETENDSSELFKFLDRFQFKEMTFRCAAKNDDYLGAQRIKYTMYNPQNVNYATAARECWNEIVRYQK